MANTQPFVLRWGIISTGKIAVAFVKDILLDPKTRDVQDVTHKVVAVGSRNFTTAQQFIDTNIGTGQQVKAYGSYDEVYAAKDVDAVYIAPPHTYHYESALAAIKAGKHVLLEKPSTSNVAELRSLLQAAKEHNVFFMEAMWTRFLPISLEIKRIAEEGSLGNPVVLHADQSGNFGIDKLPLTHRILDPTLGGGALLDLGPYPLVWAIMLLYEHPSNASSHPVSVSGTMLKTPLTGVDTNTSFTVNFSSSQAVLSTSINVGSPTFGCIVRYERGSIIIPPPNYCPKKFTVEYLDDKNRVVREETRVVDYVGGGWHFQADEVARCVRDGKRESKAWTHDKMLLQMEVFDEVRRQGGYVFPPGVEKVV